MNIEIKTFLSLVITAITAYAVSDLPPSRYLGHLGDEYEMVDF
jgi:hypothetical protein